LFPELEYTFKHALTHEVAYASLLHDRRRALHAQIVASVEQLYPDRLSEQTERLAHHALRGEVWEKALVYLRQAGLRAFARSANREAIGYLEQALIALTHLSETTDTTAQAIDIRFELRNCLFQLGELASILTYLDQAERLALKDDRRLGWVSAYTGHYFWWMGNSTQARACTERAQKIAETAGDFSLQVASNLYHGFSLHTAGEYEAAAQVLRKVMQSLKGKLSLERFGQHAFPAVNARSHLVWTLAELGAFQEGITEGREGIRLGEQIDHVYSLVVMCWGLGSLYTIKGDYLDALRQLDRALALAHVSNLRGLIPMLTTASGYGHALAGHVAEGITQLRKGIAAMEHMHFTLFHSFALMNAGEACMLSGRLEEASSFAERALVLTRERGETGFEAWALRLLGEIAVHQEQPDSDKAETHFAEAKKLGTKLGMRPLIAHCHFGLGNFLRRTAKHGGADENLATAREMYRELDMQTWLQRAETRSETYAG